MRFMMIMCPNPGVAYQEGWMPDVEAVAAMTGYNRALVESGVLLHAEGFHAPSEGFRVRYGSGGPTVSPVPFPDSPQVIGGYWMIQVSTREEAMDWARRIPASEGDMVEVRQVFDLEDFPEAIQEAARL